MKDLLKVAKKRRTLRKKASRSMETIVETQSHDLSSCTINSDVESLFDAKSVDELESLSSKVSELNLMCVNHIRERSASQRKPFEQRSADCIESVSIPKFTTIRTDNSPAESSPSNKVNTILIEHASKAVKF